MMDRNKTLTVIDVSSKCVHEQSMENLDQAILKERSGRFKRSPSLLAKVLVMSLVLLAGVCATASAIDPQTILKCLPRQYTFRATKTIRVGAKVLPCWDDVTVYSCWGRCDSYEYGDYKIPYKISFHPVCTYTERTSRQVRLRKCHPDHPDPMYEVFDATACSCTLCDSESTSCENLNG